MKIAEIRIKGFQQFKDITLDFTDPNGKPLDKICFIGRNGTGKSTILELLNEFILYIENVGKEISSKKKESSSQKEIQKFYVKFFIESTYYYAVGSRSALQDSTLYFKGEVDNIKDWFEEISLIRINSPGKNNKNITDKFRVALSKLRTSKTELLINSPAESNNNSYLQVNDVPNTSLDSAIKLFNSFPVQHNVSDQTVSEFWKILIFLIKKRESEREQFEIKPQNINKTKKQLIEEFDKAAPKILNKLANLWDKILEPAGLEFDLENASNPVQLTDNLRAYLRIKLTKEKINYNQLSTGIRNFIFRLGHIYSLYFNREIKNGFLLLDEPENSLFPDFLLNLIGTYQEVMVDKNGENNTQFFVSTHSPIIAAQFEAYERIILEWNKVGFVHAHKGEAPIGDDPNDLLSKDFQMKNLMPKEGQEKWNEYIGLRKKLIRTSEKTEKDKLISEINKIGELYNFEA